VKVYFATPIRGERMRSEIYERIFLVLERKGFKVITPHVLDESGESERGKSDEEIFERDMRLINECDILVAEVSTPSTGVGIEIQQALVKGKRVICLYLSEAKLRVSALVLGNPEIIKVEYTPETLEEKLWEAMVKVEKGLVGCCKCLVRRWLDGALRGVCFERRG